MLEWPSVVFAAGGCPKLVFVTLCWLWCCDTRIDNFPIIDSLKECFATPAIFFLINVFLFNLLALTMDRSIRLTMKNVASYVIYHELQTL